jgi:hypothetical protein
MTGSKIFWKDLEPEAPPERVVLEFDTEDCPLCGGKGYQVEAFGDCIELQGCICSSQNGESG